MNLLSVNDEIYFMDENQNPNPTPLQDDTQTEETTVPQQPAPEGTEGEENPAPVM